MKRILFLIFALASTSNASMFAQWGLASDHPTENSKSLVKFAEAGLTGEKGKLAYTIGAGGWVDKSKFRTIDYTGRETSHVKDSGFMEALVGVDPQCGPVYLTYKLGPSYVAHNDSLLGSNFQVAHEFGIGLRDKRGVRVGIVLKHFSNAGLHLPNQGRDFIGLRIEF